MNKHKLNAYPKMKDAEFQRLKDSIKTGYHSGSPIVVFQGAILDGWNRWRACQETGIKPETKEFKGTEEQALEFVILTNNRRDMDSSVRAAMAVVNDELMSTIKTVVEKTRREKISETRTGSVYKDEFRSGNKLPNLNQDDAKKSQKLAVMHGTNRTYIQQAEKIKTEAPDVFDKVLNGDLTITAAKKEVRTREIIKKQKDAPSLPDKKYQIIYADPPWKYPSPKDYYGQDVEKHYTTMSPDEIKAMNIKSLIDEDCVLYLWATAPLLDVAIDILKSWGFDYKSCIVWDKVKHNMGFYSSVRHEILLIGGKGQSAPTDKSYANQTDSVYVEERTEHSKKPEYYYEMIEKMHPLKTKRIELFARNKRDGWDKWGNE